MPLQEETAFSLCSAGIAWCKLAATTGLEHACHMRQSVVLEPRLEIVLNVQRDFLDACQRLK